MTIDATPSPCIRNCCLNESDICLGCFRSLDEICRWSQVGDTERQHIIAQAALRRRLKDEPAN